MSIAKYVVMVHGQIQDVILLMINVMFVMEIILAVLAVLMKML